MFIIIYYSTSRIRGGFSKKPVKLKLQGPSFCLGPSSDLYLCIQDFMILSLRLLPLCFLSPSYKLQTLQNLHLSPVTAWYKGLIFSTHSKYSRMVISYLGLCLFRKLREMHLSIVAWFLRNPSALNSHRNLSCLLLGSPGRHFTYHSGIGSIPCLPFSLSS